MNPTVIPNAEWLAILVSLVATGTPGGLWNGAKVRLFQNNFVPSPGMVLASLTEADFTGYAASSAIVWNTPGYVPSGSATVTGDNKQFTVGATPTVFNTIYGYYVTDSTGAILLFARLFNGPIVLSAAGQFIDVVPSYVSYLFS